MTITTTLITSGWAASASNPFGLVPDTQGWVWMGGVFTTTAGTVSIGNSQQDIFDLTKMVFPNPVSFFWVNDPVKFSFQIECPSTLSIGNALFWFGLQNNIPATRTVFVGKTITAFGGSSNVADPQLLEAMSTFTIGWYQLAQERRKVIPGSRSEKLHVRNVNEPRLDEIPDNPPGNVDSFLQRSKLLESLGNTDGAIDLVNDAIDELFRRGDFPLCDSLLAEIDPKNYSTDILLTILTATAVAKNRLNTRKRFFVAAKKAIKARNEYESGLLDGLE
jgi:hypothetical protein